ncbi:transposable element Tcb2 transposase [Trichonephila clavipes]|nr:transposable element Tcb2 transposase [Trichonephila clavipes]
MDSVEDFVFPKKTARPVSPLPSEPVTVNNSFSDLESENDKDQVAPKENNETAPPKPKPPPPIHLKIKKNIRDELKSIYQKFPDITNKSLPFKRELPFHELRQAKLNVLGSKEDKITLLLTEPLTKYHLEYHQPASKEPALLQKDNTDEIMDLALPSTTIPCQPNSPVDLTGRATDDSRCWKPQSIAYYIRIYEFFTEQAKNAIKWLIENGFTDPNDPEMQRKYKDMEYYPQCRHKAVTEWNQVFFSDESRFNLSSDDNRVRVWRPHGERLNPAFAVQQHTALTTGVMFPGAMFQQENARPHTARVSQDCLRTVTTLPWPARSPDLSPIERIWDHLGRRVWHPTSLYKLESRLQQIWNKMSQDIIQKLYASMPDRITSYIRSRGGSIGY